MNKILVFGGKGQLGLCLAKVCKEREIDSLFFLDETNGDILNLSLLKSIFEKEKPYAIINCAAYTAVDKAEDDVDLCEKINHIGPANLAQLCALHGVKMVHISTDFVFGGNFPKLLNEQDDTVPINIYGQTKLKGELEIARLLETHYILRTSWLYSEFANNFVKTMRKLGKERDELNVIVDQVGTPTYAIDLAGIILDILTTDNTSYGTYHYSNEGITSWYDFAISIFEISGIDVKVNPIPGSDYPTRAMRPAYSVMDKTKIKNTFGFKIPNWRDGLMRCIQELDSNI